MGRQGEILPAGVRLDYGHRLSHPDTDFNDNGRIHLGVLVSY